MYAAAGGASLASRQARQRQRQQKRNQQLQAKLHPPKLSALSTTEHNASTPTRTQSRQFHQLPTNYLRTPLTHPRKLSASYTTQSKILLPIDEGDNQSVRLQYAHVYSQMHHSHSHSHPIHSHPYPLYQAANQQNHYHGGILSKLVHRHSGSSATNFHQSKLPKSATATLPLVSQIEATPPTTPLGAAGGAVTTAAKVGTTSPGHIKMNTGNNDEIIVTPATPMASPGHVGKTRNQQHEALTDMVTKTETFSTGSAVIDNANPPAVQQERKCSVYRMRRNEVPQYHKGNLVGSVSSSVRRQLKDLKLNQQQPQYEPLSSNESHLCYKGKPNSRKWQICAYCEEGICVCEHIENEGS